MYQYDNKDHYNACVQADAYEFDKALAQAEESNYFRDRATYHSLFLEPLQVEALKASKGISCLYHYSPATVGEVELYPQGSDIRTTAELCWVEVYKIEKLNLTTYYDLYTTYLNQLNLFKRDGETGVSKLIRRMDEKASLVRYDTNGNPERLWLMLGFKDFVSFASYFWNKCAQFIYLHYFERNI